VEFITPPERGGKGVRPLPFPPGLAVALLRSPAALGEGARCIPRPRAVDFASAADVGDELRDDDDSSDEDDDSCEGELGTPFRASREASMTCRPESTLAKVGAPPA
jgi:hypothetical protein